MEVKPPIVNSLTSAKPRVRHCHISALAASCCLQDTLISVILTVCSTYGLFNLWALIIANTLCPSIVVRNTLGIVFA